MSIKLHFEVIDKKEDTLNKVSKFQTVRLVCCGTFDAFKTATFEHWGLTRFGLHYKSVLSVVSLVDVYPLLFYN